MYIPQGYEFWAQRLGNDSHRDWEYDKQSWLADYIKSTEHPHRRAVMSELHAQEPYESIVEIGCNTGPNLVRITGKKMAGIDASKEAIEIARALLPNAILKVGDFTTLPWPDKSFDVLLADAALMYVGPQDIEHMMKEIDRVVKKTVIIVDRHNESLLGEITGFVWGRDYSELLKRIGFRTWYREITEELWPESKNWQKYGRITVGTKL